MEKHTTKQEMLRCYADILRAKIWYLLILFLFLHGTVPAQLNKRQLRSLNNEAHDHYAVGSYASAWHLYRSVLANDANHKNAGLSAAECAVKLGYPADSLMQLEQNLKVIKAPDAIYYLAMIRHKEKKFDEAIEHLTKYRAVRSGKRSYDNNDIDKLTANCRNAKQFAAVPTGAVIRNMGKNINSEYSDYVPVIMPDESAMYFTSRRKNSTHPKRNGDNTFFEDVYVSQKNDTGWAQAESVGFPINTETNDACVALSPDGQRMIVYRTASDIVSGDLYITSLGENNRWQDLQLMGNEINSDYVETSACFSNDTNEIFFSSDRPGGLGGKDIYRIKKLPNGKWSAPMNLGPAVNTSEDDDAPFLHPDGITLYFSSKGHNSMGEYDVFSSTWDSSTNKFSEAQNLGYPINDVGNDIFFVLSVDGQRGYYSSWRDDNLGGTDIYEIDTRFRTTDLQVKTGRVVVGLKYGRALVTLTEKESGALNGYYYSHPATGKFILVLNPKMTYSAVISADGYKEQKITISPSAFGENTDLKFVLEKEVE